MIDPERNFLLKRGERIGETNQETETQVLYKLADGRLIVHRSFTNPIKDDLIERIEPWIAVQRFQLKIEVMSVAKS